MIPLVRIRDSQLSISRVGFGCARLFGGTEARTSARLIEAALYEGIRHFDTAPSYGDGSSEELLGEVLAGVPDVTITTKIGIPALERSGIATWIRRTYRKRIRPVLGRAPRLKSSLGRIVGVGRGRDVPSGGGDRRVLSRDEILRSVETSLVKLRRNRIDIVLVHEPDQFDLTADTEAIFAELRHTNVVSAYGVGLDRVAKEEAPFGSVLQSRADLGAHQDARTRIFHGVLRHKAVEGAPHGDVSLSFARFLASVPESIVLFSASTPGQIEEIARRSGRRIDHCRG